MKLDENVENFMSILDSYFLQSKNLIKKKHKQEYKNVPEKILMSSNNPYSFKNECHRSLPIGLRSSFKSQISSAIQEHPAPYWGTQHLLYNQQLLQAILVPGVVTDDVPLLHVKLVSSVTHLFAALWWQKHQQSAHHVISCNRWIEEATI